MSLFDSIRWLSIAVAFAVFSARGDYQTLEIASHERMADYTSFESREWAADVIAGVEGNASIAVEGGRLQSNEVWGSDKTHLVLSDVFVPSGVTLTITAGAVVKYCPGTTIKVEDGGSLVINGADGTEVILTAANDATAGEPIASFDAEQSIAFDGIRLQSSAANYSDNSFVIVRGFNFGRYATVSLNNTTAFLGGGQALVPVDVSGSRDTAFSFDWVAETNGVTFASGTMNWNRVSDGRKNITVPYPDGLPGCSNFVIRAVTFRCCSPNASECVVTLSEFITTDIFSHEAMADYIAFESREWAAEMYEAATNDASIAVECGRLQSNEIWGPDATHLILSDVYIPSGVTLTLSADTVIEFCQGTRIKIEDGGKLEIVGAEGHDVILRGADGVTSFGGIVRMSNGTFSDNSYVQAQGWTYSAFAGVSMHDSSTFRSSGLALIPVSVSGSRSTPFSIDWIVETNGVAYKTGTMKWNNVSEGRKNITLEYGSELDGLTNFTVRVAVERACHASPDSCNVKISDFETVDIYSHEAMADYITFESREWAAGLEGEGGRLDGNETWSGKHTIVSDVYIPAGVTLTLSADTVVEFCEGTRIKIEDGGTLKIVGAEGRDVIFRGAPGVTNYVGIVKMSNGTYTDNMYVQYTDKPYSAYPYVALHEATTYREAGKLYIPVTLSGTSRSQSFNMDWQTDKGDHGTVTWSSSSDGTKWIEIPVDATPVGGTTNHIVTITAARGCNISVREETLTILEPDYSVKGQVAINESDEDSGEFAVNGDVKTQPLFLNPVERVQYSGKWQTYDSNEAAVLRVTIETDNGRETLKEVSPTETGSFDLDLAKYPVGCYTLKHDILDEFGETLATMQKTFSIADEEDVVMHGGTLTQNETWKAGKVHVVYQTVVVPSIYTIFIEPGAIVKFMTGTGIDISQGGAFFANGIVFTHINDDTVGGDTLSDGYTVAPPMDAYFLSGAFTFGDDTELRGITQNTALAGTISTQKTLSRGSTYRVSGTVTIASGASLTIPPGTVLKMESGAAIVVNSGATLNAIGTRAAPIVITSIKDDDYSGDTNNDGSATYPQPGDWEEIKNNGGTMNLAFVSALYGGYGQYSNQGDAIIRTAGGETTMECCEVKHSNLRLVGRTGGAVYAQNCILEDGRWGIDGAVTFVNGVIADCNTGANGASLKNSILWNCDVYASGGTVSNCVAYGETTTVQGGMVYADPLFVDAANGDYRILEGSPCVDAADNTVVPELDFFGQPRITITETGGELVGQLADIGICEVMPRDVVSDIDLVPQSVRTTTNAVPGQLLFVKWEIANVGGAEVNAAWRDTVSLVSESGREVVLGDKTTSSRVAIGGSVFCSGYFTVPAISEGTWYPKVNVNSYHDIFEGSLAANNALVGERAVSVGLEAFDPSISREGVINAGIPTVLKFAFGEDDANRMVVFDVPAGVAATWGFGFMPQGVSKSGAMTASGDGVMFKVPDGATEVYVVLESDTTTTYGLFTASEQMVIANVSPATLPSSGTTTLTITGAGFGDDCEVSLSTANDSYRVQSITKDMSGNLIVTIDCSSLIPGRTYDVSVVSGDAEDTLPNAVSVIKAEGKGILDLEYSIPSSVRPGRVFTFTVMYRNTGNKDMCCPLIAVADTGNDAVNPIQFSLDGERFTPGGFQFVGTDSNGGFDGLHPGDEVTLHVMAKIPPANNGSTAISVRANTESDIMAKYTTEIDRYLTPSMKAEFASTSDEELKARGERLAQVFGSNNGEMVQNFAALAKKSYVKGPIMLVGELISFALCDKQSSNGVMHSRMPNLTFGNRLNNSSTLRSPELGAVREYDESVWVMMIDPYASDSGLIRGMTKKVDPKTDVWVWEDGWNRRLREVNPDLSSGAIAIICHGNADSKDEGWMGEMASALKAKANFKYILGINWEAEAFYGNQLFGAARNVTYAAMNIYPVAKFMRSELNGYNWVPENTTFIGHSFGAHLLGLISAGRGYRHIGLDTADTAPMPARCEVKGDCASITEYYRTSKVFGRDDAYAKRNYIVSPEGGLTAEWYDDDMGGAHSYAWQWFISNIKFAKDSGIGFWSDNGFPVSGSECLSMNSSGYIGVINGSRDLLECVYRFGEVGFRYPGNKLNWGDTYFAWKQSADLDIVVNGSVSLRDNAELTLGVPQHITVTIADNCDIQTVERWSKYRLRISYRDESGKTTPVLTKVQQEKTFNFDFKFPNWLLKQQRQSGVLVFTTDHGTGDETSWGALSDYELYPSDNTREVAVTIVNSDLPVACINGESQDGFVIRHEIPYKSYEVYEEAVKSGKTFDFKFDGSKSIGGGDKKIKWYLWRETSNDSTAIGTKPSLTRTYSATTSASYPICLTVCNDVEEKSTLSGMLEVVPVWKDDGQPIEQPRSYDPNEMRGKLGLGDPETERFVKPGEELTYTIYFENKTNATAAAQEVYVTNSLSQYLDWSTFKMGEVVFGDQIDLGLVDKQGGTSEATMKGTNFVVRTTLTLEENGDASTRDACPYQAKWYMRIVDPTTDTGWPTDIIAGFLPPNDETGRGEGHLTYSIRVREDAPANLVISNSADIVFDHNPVITTDPAWWNTVAPDVGSVGFGESELYVDEGSNVVVCVKGGDAYTNSSAKVYLTYQTAAAADVDLAKGTVGNGVDAVATSLKFPLTLKWAAGEIGEKTITIPVKTDALVEGEEVFTLQLAGASGMTLGADHFCTVRIRDAQWPDVASDEEAAARGLAALPAGATATTESTVVDGLTNTVVIGYYTKKDKKGNVTAKAMPGYIFTGWVYKSTGKVYSAKATITDALRKSKKVVPKFAAARYLRVLADPPNGGKATGGGRYAEGKVVTLKATPTKYWSFEGWSVLDANGEDGGAAVVSKAKSLKVSATNDATYVATFKPYPKVKVTLGGATKGGTVSGAGSYLEGKTVTLKAIPKKGYAFTGWYDSDGKLISLSASYKYKVTAEGVSLGANFKKESALAKPVLTWGDYVTGRAASEYENPPVATNHVVGVSYAAKLSVSAESAVGIAKVTGLPKGLAYKSGKVSGVPTKAGKFTVSVTVALTSNKKKTWVLKVPITVAALPAYARGTFTGGVLSADGGATAGLATVSVGSTGQISGKFYEGGTNWTLSASSYGLYDGDAFICSNLVAKYSWKVTKTVKGKKTTETKSLSRKFTLVVEESSNSDTILGCATAEEVVAEGKGLTLMAWQNQWGSKYKAIGSTLFYTSKKQMYKTWASVAANGLGEYDTLSVKVATNGVVTATYKYFKGTFDATSGAPQYATYTCSSTLVPMTSADAGAEAFAGVAPVFFPPVAATGFLGYYAEVMYPFTEREVPVPVNDGGGGS